MANSTIIVCHGNLEEDYGKLVDEVWKTPIKTVGHLRYRIKNLPDDMPISASCQCDSFTEWDLNLIREESVVAFHLTMTPGAELI